jgi:hypothetical protein
VVEKTLYQILGLEPAASPGAIKQRFRELARQCHPDVIPDAPASHQKFARIIEAYQLLSDPMRRAHYDRTLQLGAHKELAPELEVGARVEVRHHEGVLVCSVREIRGRMLQLAAPPGARRSSAVCEGTPVKLTCYREGRCLETEATAGEWIWMRQPGTRGAGGFWGGPLTDWRENPRRCSRRVPYQLAARLVIDGGGEYRGFTQDVSAAGLSLTLIGTAEIIEGSSGWLSMQMGEQVWTDEMPIHVVRVRHWLQPSLRTLEVGVQFGSPSQCGLWLEYLARLGVEE